VYPELAQYEHEDELGGQERLHDRDQAIVQGERLEHERPCQGHPAEQPQRTAEQVQDQPPARAPARIGGAGDVLSSLIDGVAESGQQREHDHHGRHNTNRRAG